MENYFEGSLPCSRDNPEESQHPQKTGNNKKYDILWVLLQ